MVNKPGLIAYSCLLFLSLNISSSFAVSLVGIYPIIGSDGYDLSGLAWCNNQLLTISDKHSEQILRLVEDESVFSLVIERSIHIPEVKLRSYQFPNNFFYTIYTWLDGSNYDWEGIACAQDNIFLLSERHTRILSVGDEATHWINFDIKQIESLGLLSKFNAFMEGLTIDTDDNFYISAERHPRGLVRLDNNLLVVDVVAYKEYAVNQRPDDITGLAMWKGSLFILSRNNEELCRVDKESLLIDKCESLKNIISGIKYDSDEFGVLEGLAITDKYIYLVTDNNGMNIKGTTDSRARLIILENDL